MAGIFSVGHHQPDEYYQVVEFASYKLGITNPAELPWEFAGQMRSGLQPLLFFLIHKFLSLFAIENHFFIVTVFRLIHSLFSFFAIRWLTQLLLPQIKHEYNKKAFVFLAMLLWCIPYFHARHSSENLSTSVFIIALCLFISKKIKNNALNYLAIGFLMGLSFVIRFQTGFMVAGFGLWLLISKREKLLNILSFGFAMLAAIGVGVLTDKWFYGNWTFTPYNYLDLNIIQDKVSNFGHEPWYFFITETLVQALPPFSLLIVFAFINFWIKNRKHFLAWVTFVYILTHFFVSHKELRFLFPMLNFIPFIFCVFADNVIDRSPKSLSKLNFIFKPWFVKTFVVINFGALLIFILKPANDNYGSLKFYYNNYNKEKTTLFYSTNDPYNNYAALSYYKSPLIKTQKFNQDSVSFYFEKEKAGKIVYYVEDFVEENELVISGKKFKKVYSTWPSWMKHVNFNNWLSRSFNASVFEMQ